MAYTTAEKNAIADYEVSRGTWYALHTADPGANGTANEVTGGGYARQQSTFPAAAAGQAVGSQVLIPIPAGQVTHWSRWSAASGGTCREYAAFAAAQGNPSAASEVKGTPTIGS